MKTLSKRTARSNAIVSANKKIGISLILVPIDFSTCSLKALSYGATLARKFDAKLILLYVSEPPGFPDFDLSFPLVMDSDDLIRTCKTKLREVANENLPSPDLLEKVLVRQGRAHVEINKAARGLKADLIVISTHGFSGIDHALMGSVTERVVQRAPCPVLIVREHEHEFIRG